MAISRRKFLANGVLSSLAVAAPFSALGAALQGSPSVSQSSPGTTPHDPVGDYQIKPESQRSPLDTLTQAIFIGQLHTAFQFRQADSTSPAPFTLSQVFDFKAHCCNADTAAATDESFALVFHTVEPIRAAQGVFTLTHDTLGTFELFLVPGSINGKTFEAVINRLHV